MWGPITKTQGILPHQISFANFHQKRKKKQFPTKGNNFTKKKSFIIIEDAMEICNGSTTNLQCNGVDDEILPVDDYNSP